MEQAIKKAIEGGWKDTRMGTYGGISVAERIVVTLDPLFWQALGKAEGWKGYYCRQCDEIGHFELEKHVQSHPDQCIHWWHCKWLHFIDHLASGKDADSYFNELIK